MKFTISTIPGLLSICFLILVIATTLVAQEKNVLLIVADDHGKEALGCYGNPVVKTPNLDRLANEGMRFSNAFCTSASCSASRSVILSGQHNHATGHYGHQHSYHHFSTFDDVKTLPVILGETGYRTARIGKYHLAPEPVYQFQENLDGPCRNPVAMAEQCEQFIQTEGQFFLYYCTCDPHRGGGRVDVPYSPDAFGNKPEGYPGVEKQQYATDEVQVPDFLPELPHTRAELAQYYESVSRVDQGVGKLVQLLKKYGKYDNTLIIYISDNGVAFPGAKTTLYEPGMNLPCIVRYPDQEKKGIVNHNFVSWVDLTPTILAYTGTEYEMNDFHGRSFLDVLQNPDAEGAGEVYASHTFHEVTMYYPMRVIRTKKFKLIYNIASGLEYPFASDLYASSTWQGTLENDLETYGQRSVDAYLNRPEFELYDLEQDPYEVDNLALKNTHTEILDALKAKIIDFQERTKDPWIYKWRYE